MSFIPVVQAGRQVDTPEGSLCIKLEVSHLLGGAQHPHFSATADLWKAGRPHTDRNFIAGGCMHDEILAHWPEAAKIVSLHLASAITGEPMHAETNGWYWLSGALGGCGERYHGGNEQMRPRTRDECLQVFAAHMRMPTPAARQLLWRVQTAPRDPCVRCCERDGLDERGLVCANCGGTGAEPIRYSYLRVWRRECDAMRARWREEAESGVAWLLDHATPPDLVGEWHKRVEMYITKAAI